MTVQQIQNGILYGVSGDTKPTNYPTNTVFLEQDTGNVYIYNGSSWGLSKGASSTETLTNKTIDAADQSDMNKMITADFVHETGWEVPCVTGTATHGWMLGLTFMGTSGVLQTVDSSHGLSYLITSATVANTSQAGQKSANPFTYRAWNPYFRIKFAIPVNSGRWFFGFSSSGTTPTTDTFLQNGDSGAGIGNPSVGLSIYTYSNDGSGAMVATDTGVDIDTSIHTVEIQFDDSVPNCVIKYSGATVATVTSRLPASTTPLYLYFFVEPTSTTAKTLKLYNIWYEHKRTVTPL